MAYIHYFGAKDYYHGYLGGPGRLYRVWTRDYSWLLETKVPLGLQGIRENQVAPRAVFFGSCWDS